MDEKQYKHEEKSVCCIAVKEGAETFLYPAETMCEGPSANAAVPHEQLVITGVIHRDGHVYPMVKQGF